MRRVELADLSSMDAEIRRRSFGFNRRPGARNNRGRIPDGVAPATTPLTILGSANVLQWCRADLGVTIATGVSAWADQSSAGKNYSQGTAAAQPAWSATAGPNSQAAITFDAVDDFLEAAGLTLPAPLTTPTYIDIILKQVAYDATGTDHLIGGATAATGYLEMSVIQFNVDPMLRMRNSAGTANPNSGLAVGTWGRLAVGFTGSTSDFLRLIATNATGVDAGNTAGLNGRRIGLCPGAAATNVAIAEILYYTNNSKRTQLDDYYTARYGAGLT